MQKRLPRNVTYLICALLLGLLLACENDYVTVEICENGACRTVTITRDDCLKRFGPNVCR